jgi:succinoglycan biosynthesis transport protein ExoP
MARFRSNLKIDGLPADRSQPLQTIRVTYRGAYPALVAQITNQVASLVIEENLRIREQQAEGTAEFIDTRLALAKKDVDELDMRLRAAKGASAAERAFAENDLQMLRANYNSLLQKKMEADMAADLEKRQESERFTILDPAGIPERPVRRHVIAGVAF